MTNSLYSPAVINRFWSKVQRDDECWSWTACVLSTGYGQFSYRDGAASHRRLAHRMAYELHKGSIPDGLCLDHLCRNRKCVNPDHLEPVTIRENLLRGNTFAAHNAAKTVCKHGHPFTPENTLRQRRGRLCRECSRLKSERRNRRLALAKIKCRPLSH